MRLAGLLVFAVTLWAQPSNDEQVSLLQALDDGQTSPLDMIRSLETHLARFPNTEQRGQIEQGLAKAALDAGDVERLARYGEPMLQLLPDDIVLLDRVAFALLTKNDKAAADRAYKYARTLEDLLDKVKVAPGLDAARRQQDQDRSMARALLYQSRARTITNEPDDAVRLSARAFSVDPSEEGAREWAEALHRARKTDDAILRLAEAFTVPDPRTTEAARLNDRLLLGDWYKKAHGSEAGLGEVILKAYDRMAAVMENRRKTLRALEPNAGATSAMDFTLTALDGKQFRVAALKGNIIVMDFWATWCGPCKVQHPLYEELKQKYPRSTGVVFMAVNADQERQIVAPFLEEEKWDKDVYFEDGLARMLSVQNIPATILFDRTGTLASRMDGFDPQTFMQQMTARIDALLAAK